MIFESIQMQPGDGTYPQKALVSIFVDTASDLPSLADFTTCAPVCGSKCVTVDTGDWYRLDSGGTWHLQPRDQFSNVYTKAEIDTLLLGKQDTLTIDSVVADGSAGIPTSDAVWDQIYGVDVLGYASGSYNNYNTPGHWAVSATASYTIGDRPSYFATSAQQAALLLEVIQTYDSGTSVRMLQRLWISGARYFMRGYLSTRTPSPWFDWYEYDGTQVGTIT